jgi:DNA uptake protein ComE-like DNA-binding protein
MKLPEMTEARAKGIIGYRKSNGEFIQVDELELIPQVKPIYGRIKDLVTVE